MIKLISLRGMFSGSAAAEICGKNMKLTLRLRGKACPDVKTVYLINGESIIPVPIKNGGGSVKTVDFRGLIAADDGGNFIAEGVCGMNPSELDKAKAAIRIMQFSQKVRTERIPEMPSAKTNTHFPTGRAQTQEKPKGRENNGAQTQNGRQTQDNRQTYNKAEQENRREGMPTASARSGFNQPVRNAAQITSEILDTARRLFEIQNNMIQPPFKFSDAQRRGTVPPFAENAGRGGPNAGISKKRSAPSCENVSVNAEKSVENPFPQLFPNSVWKSVSGDETRLTGTARVKGVTYGITAIRSNNRRYPPKGLKGNIRRVLSKDGKFYWIGIRTGEPNPKEPKAH